MAFTWFDSFPEVLSQLPGDSGDAVSLALVNYGMYGREPDFADMPPEVRCWALALFAALRRDIDNSKNAQKNGEKGGRPRKRAEDSHEEKTGGFENPETLGFEEEETPVSENMKAKQSKANIGKGKQSKGSGDAKTSRFSPPTPAQVGEYARGKGLAVDPERFCDFYASKGWKVGSNPMKDWRAAVRNWSRRDGPRGTPAEFCAVDAGDGGWS